MRHPFLPRAAGACLAAALAGCAGAEPSAAPAPPPQASAIPMPVTAPTPAVATPAPAPAKAAPVPPEEPDSPPSFTPRHITALPPPDARAAHEDLPEGAACRIGSNRLAPSRDYGGVAFPSADRLYLEGLGRWRVVDATSGAALESEGFELGVVTSGLSPSGACVAVLSGDRDVELFRMPARSPVVKQRFPKDRYSDVTPADDCSSAVQRQGYGSPCVTVFNASLASTGEVCAGSELFASALSGDGRRVALSPSRMGENVHEGDGIHVFDTSSRDEVLFVRRRGARLGQVTLSRDGKLLAFVDGQEVRVVSAPSGEAVSSFGVPAGTYARALVLSPQGKRMAVALDASRSAQEWALAVIDVATGKPLFTQGGLPSVGQVAFAPDGTRVAYVVKSGVRIVDTFTGDDRVAPARLYDMAGGALTGRGDKAVVSSAGHLTVWDTRDCGRVADLPNTPKLDDLLVVPDGTAAVGFDHYAVIKVDLSTGARSSLDLGSFDARDSQAISPDGKTLVVGMEDDKRRMRVVFVALTTMKERRRATISGVGPIGALLFTPDGKRLYAAAPGRLAHGDSPMGDTTVVELDIASGAPGRRFKTPGAAQHYVGAVLERGRVIVVNDDWRERATGKELPRVERTLYGVSSDHRTALWSDARGVFAWPVDEPLPASPTASPLVYGRMSVGREAILQCGDQSCLVSRVKAP